MKFQSIFILAISASCLMGQQSNPTTLSSASVELLWEIGKPDNDTREFLAAPDRYHEFRDGGFFAVGRSEAKHDWPYAHPGPADAWAGSRQHTFTVVFGLKQVPSDGECLLSLDLADSQRSAPPELQITVNHQKVFQKRMPGGAGDASIFGDPSQGREHQFAVAFPVNLLQIGANTINLTTLSGSWILYDWLGLKTPSGLELTEVSGTVVSRIDSPPMLIDRGGQLQQTVQLSVRHLGEPAAARVKLGNLESTNVTLQAGLQSFDFAVPMVEKPTPLEVEVAVAGKTIAQQKVMLKPVRQWVVYLLPHSHVDIGYTHVQTDVEQAQWKYLEQAIETARQTAGYPVGSRFKWNVEVLWAVDSYLKQASREQRQSFIEAVRAGQVGLDALYGNMLTGLCRPEELLRLLRGATEFSKLTGVPIESAMITDVPGYTWGMVPALAHSGVKYFSVGPNGGDRIGNTSKAWGDKPFWWLGPNGRDKVLLWMTGTGYYRVFSSAQNLLNYLDRLEQQEYPYDLVQVRHCLGDNAAPDVNFAKTVKDWNDKYAYPKLVIATTAEMFRDFETRYQEQLPVVRGDFTPYWEDGAGSSARETALNRASAERLVQAETLFALFNPEAYPLRDFFRAWRNVVLYDEHTWGAHNSISQPDHPFVKSQWAIKQAFALDADRQSRQLLETANASRGEKVAPPDEKMNVIDVCNTTSFSYPYALVVIPQELSSAGDSIKGSLTKKNTYVSQRLTTGELIFRPCWSSFRTERFYITDDPPAEPRFEGARAEGLTLTTSRSAVSRNLKLRLDEQTGAIASLQYHGRELVAPEAPTALNDYFYLPGGDLKDLQRNGPVKISVKERGPLMASLLVESEAPGCRRLTREIRVHALRNYVEIINTIDKLPVRDKEGMHFGFGFNVPDGVARMDVPWGVVQPEVDQIPGACRNWFTVQRWVDVSNEDYGVTWLTPDAPLIEVGGITANLIGGLAGSPLWKEHIEPSSTIYSWAMNNHWHTNYRAEQEGPTVFRYYIFPHDGPFEAAQATRLAVEYSQPLLVLPAYGEKPAAQPLTVSNRDVQVTAFKPSDDGKAWIVRLFGVSDKLAKVKLNWHEPAPKAVWLSDNSERALEAIGDQIEIPAWSIVTLRADR